MSRLRLTTVVVFICGCTNEQLQRMVEQPKYLPYTENDFFEDGRAMRTPPLGTIAREARPLDPSLSPRQPNGEYVQRMPVPITLAALRLGRKYFDITCAACHGLIGDGNSVVAEKMSLRAPPSLHNHPERPDGYFFEVITEGYGLMPSYASQIPTKDRWAVVGYVRALQASQRASLADAPPQVRAQLLREPR